MATHAHTTRNIGAPDQATGATSRRALFAGGAALAATGLIAAAPAGDTNPDAELIRLCADFDALERQMDAMYTLFPDDDERDAHMEPLQAAQQPLLDRMCQLPTHTPEGLRARLDTVLLWDKDLDPELTASELGEYANNRMMAALLRDMHRLLPGVGA